VPITAHSSNNRFLPTTPSSNNGNSTFDHNALTSSPVDFDAFCSNNTLLKDFLHDSAPLPTDVQQYIWCVTSAVQKFYIQKSILTETVRAQGEALGKRKVTTGKRISIKDDQLLSTPDVLAKIVATHNTTKAKTKKRPKNLPLLLRVPSTLIFLLTLSCK